MPGVLKVYAGFGGERIVGQAILTLLVQSTKMSTLIYKGTRDFFCAIVKSWVLDYALTWKVKVRGPKLLSDTESRLICFADKSIRLRLEQAQVVPASGTSISL